MKRTGLGSTLAIFLVLGGMFAGLWAAPALGQEAAASEVGESGGEGDEFRERMMRVLEEEGVGVAGLKNGRFFIQSPDGLHRLNIGGRIQPRVEFERREEGENVFRARFRRLRVDFRGHAFGEDLTFRIMPEMAGNVRLDTAYVNQRFSDGVQVRAGQYNVPFGWERDSSSSRHQLTERSTAHNTFQWPGGGGKDVGVTLHGELAGDVRYGVGMFGGEGRNLAGGEGPGGMVSGRATWSPLGEYPGSEALVRAVEEPNLSFGVGGWYANRSAVTDWYMWDEESQTADAYAFTVDGTVQAGRFSGHASGFHREVDPREAEFGSYSGSGYNVQGGVLLIPERLFGSLRVSEAAPDRDRDEGKTREVVGGVQIYQRGHRSKIHVEAGWEQRHDAEGWVDSEFVRVQYQLLF